MSTMQMRASSALATTFEEDEPGLPGLIELRLGDAEALSHDSGSTPAIHEPPRPSRFAFDPGTPEPMPSRTRLQAAPAQEIVARQPRVVAPVPHITIHAFCESHDVLSVLESASADRKMSRATVEIFAGGIWAATEHYRHNPVSNLIIVERRAQNDVVLAELAELAELCDAGTKVLMIGYSNDVGFYRELMRRGVSEYMIAPVDAASLVAAVSGIYHDATSGKLGQVYAFVGAKGGVGSSTVAHNVGWSIARRFASDVILADLDLPFGTAALNLNMDTNQGIAEAIQDASRLDEVLLDRLLTKCDDHFSLLAAPGRLDTTYDLDAGAFAGLLDVAQANVPFTILDIPHVWTSWARHALVAADEIVITAVPDLASLRNAKGLVDFLRQARPHDGSPRLVLNQVGVAKRPEIKPSEFAKTLGIEPLASISFDAPLFGTAANNGKMIADNAPKSSAAQGFADIAAAIVGRKELRRAKSRFFNIRAILGGRRPKV